MCVTPSGLASPALIEEGQRIARAPSKQRPATDAPQRIAEAELPVRAFDADGTRTSVVGRSGEGEGAHADEDAASAESQKGEASEVPSPENMRTGAKDRRELNELRRESAEIAADIFADASAKHHGVIVRDLEVSFATAHKWTTGALAVTLRDIVASPTEVIDGVATGLRAIVSMRRATGRALKSITSSALIVGARTGQFQAKVDAFLADRRLSRDEQRELLSELGKARHALEDAERAVKAAKVVED
jgi:hypothetical protein